MKKFYYEAMDATGQVFEDEIEAESQKEAATTLRHMGLFVTRLSEKPIVKRSWESSEPVGVYVPLFFYVGAGFAIFVFGVLIGMVVGINLQG